MAEEKKEQKQLTASQKERARKAYEKFKSCPTGPALLADIHVDITPQYEKKVLEETDRYTIYMYNLF